MGLEAVLVFFLVLTPGVIADAVYRFVLWRPDPEEHLRLTRALLFSVVGLVLYLLVVETLNISGAKPLYLLPGWWSESWQVDSSSVSQIAIPWALHAGASLVVAFGVAKIMGWNKVDDLLREVMGQSMHKTAWDEFAAANHDDWIIVKLADERQYVGRLGVVSGDEDRDFVLWNPYPYDPEANTFEVTGTAGMFVPGDQVASVIVPMDADELEAHRVSFGVYNLKTGERVDGEGERGQQEHLEEE